MVGRKKLPGINSQGFGKVHRDVTQRIIRVGPPSLRPRPRLTLSGSQNDLLGRKAAPVYLSKWTLPRPSANTRVLRLWVGFRSDAESAAPVAAGNRTSCAGVSWRVCPGRRNAGQQQQQL
ncbi:hypothetical protein Q5P01_019173 [Channa striata]|uniref:Uncharacterized protein n=1 Tax=Channa striata TaxID=64152 RepID=A0AA88M0W5_CHASR|nr:hypothetical protein Q5P01_019173 [Channa striata]